MWLKSICLFLPICFVGSANILCLMHVPLYSHSVVFHTLCKELAERGHTVRLISAINENIQMDNVSFSLVDYENNAITNFKIRLYDAKHSNILTTSSILEDGLLFMTELLLNDTKVQKLLKSEIKFDLVIMPQHQNEAMKGFCYHFQAPCVLLAPMAASRWSNPYMSNSGPPSYVPEFLSNFQSEMNFMERFYNSIAYFINRMHTYIVTYPKHERLLKKYFPNPPSLYDLMYNASLMLVNSHYSIHNAVPYGPNMVEVGGLHIKPPKPLPHDLQEFLDNATHGVVYFSLGSSLPPGTLLKHVKTAILNVFSKLKQKVLCKWDVQDSVNMENIKMLKWLPQNAVLAHPNVKVFVTQGGQMSMTEAVHHGVPILGMPIWVDQYTNVMHSVKSGYGLSVPLENFSEEKFENALHELLYNTSYYNNMRKRSLIFHDRPMKPLDTAVFWIEHIVKYGGGSHLRTAASNLAWYQYFLIDVIIALILIAVLAIASTMALLKVLGINRANDVLKKNE